MIRTAITAAAYVAIGFPRQPHRRLWAAVTLSVDKLAALSRPSESISDVIIRLAAGERCLP
jgi:hypothetical protein